MHKDLVFWMCYKSMPHKSGKHASPENEFHTKVAKSCFNETWNFLDKKSRSKEEDIQMIMLSHASRYHWGKVGTPRNMAVADWQISRVYADLKQPDMALLFAKSSLEACEKNKLTDMLLSGYEGMARGYAVANQPQEAQRYLQNARKQLELVKDEEDRKIYAQQIEETEALLRK